MNLEEQIKKWIILDNKHQKLNEEILKIKNEKNDIFINIQNFFIQHNIKSHKIKISDGYLNFMEIKQPNAISFKFLENCFEEYFNNLNDDNRINNIDIQNLLIFIKNKRTFKSISFIKRNYKE